MAKVRKSNIRTAKVTYASPFSIYWTKENYIYLGIGILTLIIGFYLLSSGNWDSSISLNVAPILLVIGYLVVLPLSILFRKKNKNKIDS